MTAVHETGKFMINGIINVYKEKGYTSHDVVAVLRKIAGQKKIGHTGTLDPDATGVLPVCLGRATKLCDLLTDRDKTYEAVLLLGKTTDTQDISGEVLKTGDTSALTEEQVKNCICGYIGEYDQLPPMYSALKVNGKKLYEYARNGEEVEIKERDIEIMMIQLISFDKSEIVFDVKCSKGTYIRSLCVDIAKKLGYPGHMSHLTRIVSGDFSLEKCYTLEDLQQDRYKLLSVDEALDSYPKIILKDPTVVYHGKMIKSDLTGQVAICDDNKHVLAIYESNGEGYLKNVRGLW